MAVLLEDIPKVDVTVKAETLEDDLFKIYSELFKDAKKDELVFEELKGGYINSIRRVYPKNDKNKSIVFRTFSLKINEDVDLFAANDQKKQTDEEKQSTDQKKQFTGQEKPNDSAQPGLKFSMLFSRMTEYLVMNEVSKHGLCQPVFAQYNNGICYGYTQGVTVNSALMLTTDFLTEMATKLAEFHSIKLELPGIEHKTHFDKIDQQFKPLVEKMIGFVEGFMMTVDEFPYNVYPKPSAMLEMREQVLNLIKEVEFGDIVFCHNDLNKMNLIWDSQKRTLGFIDFDMSMNNYESFEIGQLFFQLHWTFSG